MSASRLIALGAILGAANSCSRPAPPAKPASWPTIEATYQRYDDLIRRINGDSIAALYTADGEMVGGAARGPAAIAAFLNGFRHATVPPKP